MFELRVCNAQECQKENKKFVCSFSANRAACAGWLHRKGQRAIIPCAQSDLREYGAFKWRRQERGVHAHETVQLCPDQ